MASNPVEPHEEGVAAGGSARAPVFLRAHPPLVALVLGLAAGAAVGMYVRRWWGAGLFVPSSLISAVALLLAGIVVVVCIVAATRGPEGRTAAASTLGLALVGGTLAGAALGPGYQPAANWEGRVEVHVTAPVRVDWIGDGFCWTQANSSEVGGLWFGTWSGSNAPTEGLVGFTTDSGALGFRFGNEGNDYDSFGSPRPRLDIQRIAPMRLAGDVAFSGLPTRGRGLLPDFPGQPLDGTLTWSCDPTRPAR